MAGKSGGPGLFGNWAAIAAVLVLGTYFFNTVNLPFQGSRPAASGNLQRSLAETQDVDARLWQDPFGAVRKDVENQAKATNKSGCHDGPKCLGLSSEGNVLVLGVMLPGSSYSESEELRRQIRYAVLSSLGTQNYFPLDSEHIGYFPFLPNNSALQNAGTKCPAAATAVASTPVAPPSAAANNGSAPAPVATNIAYEEFAPLNNGVISKLFVLWVNEDDLVTLTKSCPLWGLSTIQKTVQGLSPRATIQFLGPATSSTLQGMIVEALPAATCKPNSRQNPPTYLTLYNFFATAEEGELQTADCRNQPIGDFFRTAGIAYYRTIASDLRLADALIVELTRRGMPMACDSKDRIALISEWDTAYGRSFRDSIKKAYQDKSGCTAADSTIRFIPVSYMRGLDGRLPESQTRSNADAGNGRSNAGTGDGQTPSAEQILNLYAASPKIERPEGNAQYDYLRRLGMGLDERLRAEIVRKDGVPATNQGKIFAIGVVGSDIYDKLAVLQQLHPQFPGAVFFTTDLDARLYHPAEAEWARNLIVASSYDLQLDSDLQGDIPPFRSGYQTAAFLTTRLVLEDKAYANCQNHAVCRSADRDLACKRELTWAQNPKLFQIPYRRLFAYPLQTDLRNSNANPTCPLRARTNVARPISGLFSPPPSQDWTSRAAGSLLLAGLFFAAGLSFSRNFRAAVCIAPAPERVAWQRWGMLCVLALAMVGVPLMLVPSILLAAGQPLLWIGAGSIASSSATAERRAIAEGESSTWVGYFQCVLTFILCGSGGFLYYWNWPDIAAVLTSHGDGEPILLLSGISLWPALAIRLVAIALCVKFIGHVIQKLDANLADLATKFQLLEPAYRADGILDAVTQTGGAVADVIKRKPKYIWRYVLKVLSTPLLQEETKPSPNGDPTYKVTEFWNAYRSYGSTPARLCRIGVIALACVFLQVLLYAVGGEWPHAIGRGELVRASGDAIFWAETILLWILVVYVADATIFCLRFIREMQRFPSIWPGSGPEPSQYKPDSEWKDIEFVGNRTVCIVKVIPYPFLILTLLILAQSPLLDDMPRDWPRLIEMGAAFAVILFCAVMLPIEAQKLRDIAVARLSRDRLAAHEANADDYKPEKIEPLIHRIQDYREGAFTPLPQQPIVQALLYPLSGIGGTALLQYFT